MAVASSPTSSEIRAPQISSVRTERPLSSVPSGKEADGGTRTPPVAFVTCNPSLLASNGANSATRMNTVRMPSPRTPARLLRNSRQVRRADAVRLRRRSWRALRPAATGGAWTSPLIGASRPHARVEDAVKQVRGQVRDDHRTRGDQERALQHPVVRDAERLAGEQAEAGDREDRLDG